MENLDLILLTTLVTVLFVVFILATYREFNTIGKTTFESTKESGPRADLLFYIAKLFDDTKTTRNDKIEFLQVVKKTIAEIEIGTLPEQKNQQ